MSEPEHCGVCGRREDDWRVYVWGCAWSLLIGLGVGACGAAWAMS